jgi:chromosome segregation ATPase
MELLTIILTLLVGSPLTLVLSKLFARRQDEANARLSNAEADKKELENRRTEVVYYREVVENLVGDMKALRSAQEAAEKETIGEMKLLRDIQEAAQESYGQKVIGLHEQLADLEAKLDKANLSLDKANKVIQELQKAGTANDAKTKILGEELARANRALDTANEALITANKTISDLRDTVAGGNAKIEKLQEEITKLLVDRAEKE